MKRESIGFRAIIFAIVSASSLLYFACTSGDQSAPPAIVAPEPTQGVEVVFRTRVAADPSDPINQVILAGPSGNVQLNTPPVDCDTCSIFPVIQDVVFQYVLCVDGYIYGDGDSLHVWANTLHLGGELLWCLEMPDWPGCQATFYFDRVGDAWEDDIQLPSTVESGDTLFWTIYQWREDTGSECGQTFYVGGQTYNIEYVYCDYGKYSESWTQGSGGGGKGPGFEQ